MCENSVDGTYYYTLNWCHKRMAVMLRHHPPLHPKNSLPTTLPVDLQKCKSSKRGNFSTWSGSSNTSRSIQLRLLWGKLAERGKPPLEAVCRPSQGGGGEIVTWMSICKNHEVLGDRTKEHQTFFTFTSAIDCNLQITHCWKIVLHQWGSSSS